MNVLENIMDVDRVNNRISVPAIRLGNTMSIAKSSSFAHITTIYKERLA